MKFAMYGQNDDGTDFEEGPLLLKATTASEAADEAEAQWVRDDSWYRYNVREVKDAKT